MGKNVNIPNHTQGAPVSSSKSSKFPRTLTAYTVAGILSAISYEATPEKSACHTKHAEANNCLVLSSGEISKNFINSFEADFTQMKRGQYALLDINGKIIEIGRYPQNWDQLNRSERQKFRDARRKELAEKYEISEKEPDMLIISPHSALHQSTGAIIDDVQKNASQQVIDDPKGRTRQEYIRDEFANLTGNKAFDEFAERYIIGLVGGESRYDNSSHSHSGAIGIFQLMPHMINNDIVNPHKYSQEEVSKSLIQQTELAKNLMRANFSVLYNKYAERVAKQYFDNNMDDAVRFVIAPLTFNAYNTGSPNLQAFLNDFLKEYPNQQSIARDFHRSYSENMKMDIFYFMTQYGKNHPNAHTYKSESSLYVFKSIAMTNAMNGEHGNPSEEYTPPEKETRFSRKIAWVRDFISNSIK